MTGSPIQQTLLLPHSPPLLLHPPSPLPLHLSTANLPAPPPLQPLKRAPNPLLPSLTPRPQRILKRPGPTNQQTRIIVFRHLHLPSILPLGLPNLKRPCHTAYPADQLRFDQVHALTVAPPVAEGREVFYAGVLGKGGPVGGVGWGEPAVGVEGAGRWVEGGVAGYCPVRRRGGRVLVCGRRREAEGDGIGGEGGEVMKREGDFTIG